MLSGICFKIIHAGGRGGSRGMGARRDEGKLATLLIIVETGKDGSMVPLYYSDYFCV